MSFNFNNLPVSGSKHNGALVLQSFPAKYDALQEECSRVCGALNRVLKEFRDLGVGELNENQLSRLIAIDSVNGVRDFVKTHLLANEGTIKIGNLTIKPDFIAQGLDIAEVNDLVRANKQAIQELWSARLAFKAASFAVVEGSVQPKDSTLADMVNRCLVVSKGRKAEKLFELASKLVEVQQQLNAEFAYAYKVSLDDLITLNESGEVEVSGVRAKTRLGE